MPTSLSERKLVLFQELNQVSEKMMQFTPDQLANEDDALGQFEELLQKREEIMAAIDELADDNLDSAHQQLVSTLLQEGEKLNEYNKKIQEIADATLRQLRNKMKKVQEGRHSSRSYEPQLTAIEGAFVDKRR